MDALLTPSAVGAALGRDVVDVVVVRRETRSASVLTFLSPQYAGPPGPAQLVLKVGGRDADVLLLRALGDRLPAPATYAVGHRDGVPYRLTEAVSDPTLAGAPSADGLVAAAIALASVHALPTAGLERVDPTPWLWERAAEGWGSYVAAYDPPEADRFATLLADPPARPGPIVVCHGDAHPGNVVLRPGGAHLIDWEDWRLGPGAEDLAFLLSDLPPEQRSAWAAPAVSAYAAALGRPLADVVGELAAALAQVPKMLPFWHLLDPDDATVSAGSTRQWAAWRGGTAALGL